MIFTVTIPEKMSEKSANSLISDLKRVVNKYRCFYPLEDEIRK